MAAVLGVKDGREDDYLQMARTMGEMFLEFGALEVTENWEADIADGEVTDFRRAVAAEADEKIVLSWIVWPDKETSDQAHGRMMEDERMQAMGQPDMMDGKRMIFGGFRQIYHASKGE